VNRLRGVLASLAMSALVVFLTDETAGQQQPPADPPMPAVLKNYRSVTAERLKNPNDEDWLMIRRTYDGWGFSPVTDITPANVQRLCPAWVFSTAEPRVHQSAPLVNGGVMFVTSPNNQVIAIDVKSGNLLWRYRRPLETGMNVPHQTNRGVALYGDKVFFAAGEAVLVALDARTGREVWTAVVADNKSGYYPTLAPLVASGVVMVGASGGEFGIRGFVAGFDVETGKEKWRTYTVPAPGEPGSETWPKGDHWKTGGAPVWVTGNYDPETNLAYWGTGNGGPTIGDQRPGDNLYVTSTLALDVATGAIKGHHQYHPNDSWDWDEVSPPILVDYQRNGRTIKGLIDVARDGYIWFLERSNGPIKFVEGKPFVYQDVFRSLDPVTGRPDVDPEKKPMTGKRADFCPGVHGGKNWPPIAFSPRTRMITGQHVHDWRGTTPILKQILESTGKFEVRINEEFRGAGPETLANYDLVVVNYYNRGDRPLGRARERRARGVRALRLLWTTQYGMGRVFVTTLGHSPTEVAQLAFGTTFARGAEWAATGKVTLSIPPELAR
jgi:alcohol dehydrogenase (cytochrome c)